MGRLLIALWICMTAACPAAAGAWLREKGHGFTSASVTLYRFQGAYDYKTTAYAEWGMAERLTLGIDINEQPGLAGHALIFARYPLWDLGTKGRFAAELGLGAHHWLGDWAPMGKLTLSYGKGLETRWGNGWLAVDTGWERRSGTKTNIFKLDMTAGLSTARRIDPMLQVETAYVPGHPLFWTITPSLLIEGSKRRTWVLGLERKSDLPGSLNIKFSLWREF